MSLFDPFYAVRRRLAAATIIGGFFGGATFGLVMTRLGKIMADAPPGTPGNYAWNAVAFGLLAAVVSPMVSWSFLRRAPLWRTIAEPLAYALFGAGAAVVLGIGPAFLILPAMGLVTGFARLAHRYPDRAALPPSNESAPLQLR